MPSSMSEHAIKLPDGTSIEPENAHLAVKLLGEMRPAQVRLALMEQLKVSRATATRYVAAGRYLLAEQLRTELPDMAAMLVERLWRQVDRAEQEHRTGAAIKAINAIAKLTGVAQPSRVTVTIAEHVELPELSTEELEILAKVDLGSSSTH